MTFQFFAERVRGIWEYLSMEAPDSEDDVTGMIESELDLDDLIEENFELRDPDFSKSRLHKKK